MKTLISFLLLYVGANLGLHAQRDYQAGGADLKNVVSDTGAVTVIYRKAATQQSFASLPVQMVLPLRPLSPSYSIDFRNEKTREDIPAEVEYSQSAAMEQSFSGESKPIVLIPGQDMYFRVKASGGNFSSASFCLIVPKAPVVENISIDYEAEKLQNLPGGAVWKLNDGVESSVKVALTSLIPAAGQPPLKADIYVPATDRSFASEIRTLHIAARPVITLRDMKKQVGMPAFVPDAVTSIDNSAKGIVFTSSDETVARVENDKLRPVGVGSSEITAAMPANANGPHFAATPVKAMLSVTGADGGGAADLVRVTDLVICNGRDDSRLKVQNPDGTIGKLILFNAAGKLVHKAEHYNNDFEMQNLKPGTYYYLLHATVGGQLVVKKGFVEVVK